MNLGLAGGRKFTMFIKFMAGSSRLDELSEQDVLSCERMVCFSPRFHVHYVHHVHLLPNWLAYREA